MIKKTNIHNIKLFQYILPYHVKMYSNIEYVFTCGISFVCFMYPHLTRRFFYRKHSVATKNIYVEIIFNTMLNCDIQTGYSFRLNVLTDKKICSQMKIQTISWSMKNIRSILLGGKKYNENILVFFCTAPDNIRPRVDRCSSLTRLGSCSALWMRGRSIRIFQVFLVVKMLLGSNLDCWAG